MAKPKKYKISLTDNKLKILKSVLYKKKTKKTFGTDARLSLIWMKNMAKFLPMNSLLRQIVSVWPQLLIQLNFILIKGLLCK